MFERGICDYHFVTLLLCHSAIYNQPMNSTNKVALITGGAHRVGKAITMMLAQMGAHVVVNYNSSASAPKQTVREAQALGVQALAVQCDVSNLPDVQRMGGRSSIDLAASI